MKDTIKRTLDRLLGTRLIALGRAADLQHFTFALPAGDGATVQLHITCAWRVVGSTGILVGGTDYGRPAAAETAEDAFERGAVGARLRDVGNAAVRQLLGDRGLDVTGADADALGGLVITLRGGLRIEVFPDAAPASHDEVEFWRLFEADAPHLVISTDGVDYVA